MTPFESDRIHIAKEVDRINNLYDQDINTDKVIKWLQDDPAVGSVHHVLNRIEHNINSSGNSYISDLKGE